MCFHDGGGVGRGGGDVVLDWAFNSGPTSNAFPRVRACRIYKSETYSSHVRVLVIARIWPLACVFACASAWAPAWLHGCLRSCLPV